MGIESSRQEIISSNEGSNENIFDFYNLDNNGIEILKDEIEKSKGLVRIFIHPLAVYREEVENIWQSKELFVRVLQSKKSPPVFVLEDEKFQKDLLRRSMQRLGEKLPNRVYTVETMHNHSIPKIPGTSVPENFYEEQDKLSLDGIKHWLSNTYAFLIALHRLGVKKILIGGSKLEHNGDHFYRCVGSFVSAAQALATHDIPMEIKLSEGTAPLRRSDVRDLDSSLL